MYTNFLILHVWYFIFLFIVTYIFIPHCQFLFIFIYSYFNTFYLYSCSSHRCIKQIPHNGTFKFVYKFSNSTRITFYFFYSFIVTYISLYLIVNFRDIYVFETYYRTFSIFRWLVYSDNFLAHKRPESVNASPGFPYNRFALRNDSSYGMQPLITLKSCIVRVIIISSLSHPFVLGTC